jgi:sugar lactone lactonase YvrE
VKISLTIASFPAAFLRLPAKLRTLGLLALLIVAGRPCDAQNLWVTDTQYRTITLYTYAGVAVKTISAQYPGGYPYTEYPRNVAQAADGSVWVYNGTNYPYISKLSADGVTWSNYAYSQFSATGSPSYGGIGTIGQSVFVSSLPINVPNWFPGLNSASGLVSEVPGLGTALNVGLDGLLYVIADGWTTSVTVYDPATLLPIRDVALTGSTETDFRGVAALANSHVIIGTWDGYIQEYDASGTFLRQIRLIGTANSSTAVAQINNVSIGSDGSYIAGSYSGDVYIVNSQLTAYTHFNAAAASVFANGALSGSFPSTLALTLNAFMGTPSSFAIAASTFSAPSSVSGLTYSAANLPPGLTFNPATLTISGTPTTTGTYATAVTATTGGNNLFSASTVINITVSYLPTTVTLGNLTQTYSGSALPVSVTTNPSATPVSVTYNGLTYVQGPSFAGTYSVVATVNGPTYYGTASGTLTILPATPVITWSPPATVPVGSPLNRVQLNATTTTQGVFSYSPGLDSAFATPGPEQLEVTFTPNDNSDFTPASAETTIVVVPATPPPAPVVAAPTVYNFTTLAGSTGVHGNADGTGTAAIFGSVAGIAVDSAENVYVADSPNYTIRQIAPGGIVTTLAGQAGHRGNADGTGSAAQFNFPQSMAIDSTGDLFVADTGNNELRVIRPGGVVSTLRATLLDVTLEGIAVDGTGDIYYSRVGTPNTNDIACILPGGLPMSLAGSLAVASGSSNGVGAGASFDLPLALAVDSAENVYVADSINCEIRKITPGGTVTTLAGAAGVAGDLDGMGTAARFRYPEALAVDANGNIFVGDTGNGTIREITPSGVVTTVGGTAGIQGSTDGLGAAASFGTIAALAVDSNGVLYISDSGNNTIRVGTPYSSPAITVPPVSQSPALGGTVTLSVTAVGVPPLTFTWFQNGNAITSGVVSSGLTSTLTLAGITTASGGTYSVTVGNSEGFTTGTANLTVTASNPAAVVRLVNLSARAFVSTGANVLISGFGVSGTGVKQLLLRGVGPGLYSTFQVPDDLDDVNLSLFDNGQQSGENAVAQVISSNNGWQTSPVPGNSPEIPQVGVSGASADIMNMVGAFPYLANSLDASLLVTVPPSSFTAQVGGLGASPTGVALAEIYDEDAGIPSARLVNISARAQIGTGFNILIAGFVVQGNTDELLLIRGVGPGLTNSSGLPGTITNPQLQLFDDGQQPGEAGSPRVIATNAGWGSDPTLGNSPVVAGVFPATAQEMITVGAFPLVVGSTDAAMYVSVPPGHYTAQLTGVGGTTGIGLVEVYEEPAP